MVFNEIFLTQKNIFSFISGRIGLHITCPNAPNSECTELRMYRTPNVQNSECADLRMCRSPKTVSERRNNRLREKTASL